MLILYRLLFWLLGVAAALSLRFASQAGLLARPVLVLGILGLGVVLQFAGALFSPMWALGLSINAGLAVYLLIVIRRGV